MRVASPSVRSAARVVAWNLVLLLVVAVLTELVFGGWFRGGDLGALHVPHDVTLRHDVSAVRPGRGIIVYRRDQWGLRGDFDNPAQVDILAVGGSTTNELYLDESETWTAVLQRRFTEAGRHVVVANAGVDGQSTVGHIVNLEYWFPRVPHLRPKLILFYVGINDTQVTDHARYDAIVPRDFWGRARRYISNNSAINDLFRTVRGMIRARRARVIYYSEPGRLVPISEPVTINAADYDKALAAYADRIRVLAERTRAMGARPVFVNQQRGDAFPTDGGMIATGRGAIKERQILALYNRTMMTTCRALQALCVDLAAEIRLTPQDFADYIHTNPAGSRKIGDYLYARLSGVVAAGRSGGEAQPDPGAAHR